MALPDGTIVITDDIVELSANDDELLAIDSIRLLPGQWPSRRKQYQAGNQVKLLIARRGQLMELEIAFAKEPKMSYQLKLRKDASKQQKQQLNNWLGADFAKLSPEASAHKGAKTEQGGEPAKADPAQ